PLIQGSSTPSAKEVATAASRASPPASRTSAPAWAASRCCAATMPPRLETAGLRTTWEREKLLIDDSSRVRRRQSAHSVQPRKPPEAEGTVRDRRPSGEAEPGGLQRT